MKKEISYMAIPGIIKSDKLSPVINENIMAARKLREIISEYFHTDHWYQTKSRRREYVEPRQLYCYWARKKRILSDVNIGIYVGGLDRSTVITACKTVENLKGDFSYRRMFNNLELKIINELNC